MRPLILDYQVSRSEDDLPICYEYDGAQSLNVIKIGGVNKPFIDANPGDVELMTKSKEVRESDDEHFSLLELSTKTLVARERDDERTDLLMELITKTRVQREQDDEHFSHN
ncbi:MAG: hypothetical protein V4592_14715 [Bacteroidota bacterium]